MTNKIIDLPKGYEPSKDDEYMCDRHLEYFRIKLNEWKNNLGKESENTLDHLKKEAMKEPDDADQASIEYEFTVELRTRDRYRKLLNKIEVGALERISERTY